MSNRRAAWPRGRWLIGAAAVVLALAIVWALLVPGADWLARHDVGSARGSLQAARDAARGRLLTLGAGLLAAGALLFTARNFALSREGQVTDRYTKAIEQLGSDKLDVRIGGIYALERVARDSAKDQPTVMEVLTAFIREHSREPWPESDADSPEQERLTRPDVQAAVTVVGRRDAKRDILSIDLTGAHLAGAHLAGADLTGAHLTGAHFDGADLAGADLTGADLTGAHFEGADLAAAWLSHADLTGAHFDGANLPGAHLPRAWLSRAGLTGAYLRNADLAGAHFDGANLTRAGLSLAHLTGADLDGADLTDADLTDADLTGVRWPEGVQVPEGWMVDSDSSRLKPRGQLSEVTAHYL